MTTWHNEEIIRRLLDLQSQNAASDGLLQDILNALSGGGGGNTSSGAELLRVDRVDNSPGLGDTVYYQGYAIPGTSVSDNLWYIKRVTEFSGGDVEILYSNGSKDLDIAWNNRLTITYS